MKVVVYPESKSSISVEDVCGDSICVMKIEEPYILKQEPDTKKYRWYALDNAETYWGNSHNTIKGALENMHWEGAETYVLGNIKELGEWIIKNS